MSGPRTRLLDAAGVRLRAVLEGQGPPLLILHGFTGSAESMQEVGAGLRDRWRTVRLDLVGHGGSDAPRSAEPYTMESCVEQVAAALEALELPRAHLLGYSMGGRVALALCVRRPERARSALLVGASAGLRDPAARAARRRDDEALARLLERQGLEPFVDEWMARPLFASQRRLGAAVLARARAQRLAGSSRGLAGSLRGMGAAAQPPLHEQLPGVRVPVALVTGAEDTKFTGIARELAARLPDARLHQLARAGHACHLEAPAAFLRLARDFFADVEAGARPRLRPAPTPDPPNLERSP